MNVTLEKIKCWAKGLKENKSGVPSGLFQACLKKFQEMMTF